MTVRTVLSERLSERPTTTSKPVSGTDVVTVACKIPSGIRIAAHVWEEYDEPGPMVSKSAKRAVEVASFVIRGPNSTLPPGSSAGLYPLLIGSGGYAITTGVPKDLWDQWYEANRNSDMVRRRLVFCASSEERAKDEGRECAAELSGFEPVQVGAPGEKIPDRRLGRDRLSPHTFEGPRR